MRGWLESEGHRFSSHSDTEVIVHLWEQVGSTEWEDKADTVVHRAVQGQMVSDVPLGAM